MPKPSAGILMYRRRQGLEVLLVHPGGPFWSHKDLASWSLPKGEIEALEDPLAAARREFREETGFEAAGAFIPLTQVKQRSGKVIHAWAVEGDLDATRVKSNLVALEWPRGSGRTQEFPEVDRAEWFDLAGARRKLMPGQLPFLDELVRLL
jgi:predicted NUDIX family NTP pyrophosphohydrolase